VNWPADTPNPYGGGGFYAGEDENMAEDVGGDGNEEGNEQDDPANVYSATSTHNGSNDDMQG
jgi:hypothetical protein